MPWGDVFISITRRSGSGKGTGLRRTALTTEKMALFVPMPSASAATAASVKVGLFRNICNECFRSLRNVSMRNHYTTTQLSGWSHGLHGLHGQDELIREIRVIRGE